MSTAFDALEAAEIAILEKEADQQAKLASAFRGRAAKLLTDSLTANEEIAPRLERRAALLGREASAASRASTAAGKALLALVLARIPQRIDLTHTIRPSLEEFSAQIRANRERRLGLQSAPNATTDAK